MKDPVIVVGGGVTGLAAGLELATGGTPVTVVESAAQVGGKVRTLPVGDVAVEAGVESFLLRGGEVSDMLARVGLADELVPAASLGAAVSRRARLRPLPARTMLGIPADLRALAASRAISTRGVARAAVEPLLPGQPPAGDVAVGAYVAARMGVEVARGLVDPLLGGVYAGRAEELSLQATMPALAPAVARHRSLTRAARAVLPPPAGPAAGAVFGALRGGMQALPEAMAAAIRAAGGTVRCRCTVQALERTPAGWRLRCGPDEWINAAGVVLALPAAPAGRLLAAVSPTAAAELGGIDYASVALVALVYAGRPPLPPYTGYLVPATERRPVKAVTVLSAKWPWLAAAAPHCTVLRCSFGRYGDVGVLQRDDADLVAAAEAEVAALLGLPGTPVASRVTRWGGALPQYTVGHRDRVARARAALAGLGGLALAGAAYDGVGVPACLAAGRRAAAQVQARTMEP